MDQQIGGYAFLGGAGLAILLGLLAGFAPTTVDASLQAWLGFLLVILGLIVGWMNIGDKDIHGFLLAAVALLLVGSANLARFDMILPSLGTALDAIVTNISWFVAPAALIVALKSIKDLGKGM